MIDLKKENAALKRQEVILLNTVDALRIEIETDKLDHAETLEELNNLKKSINMRNTGIMDLEDRLRTQRTTIESKEIGFTNTSRSGKTALVKAKAQSHVILAKQPSPRIFDQHSFRKQGERRCFYCNHVGHIKSRCPEFHKFLRKMSQVSNFHKKQVRHVKQKGEVCHVAFSSASHQSKERWFFDRGYSRHMTGNPEFLVNIKKCTPNSVKFGNGIEGRVLGIGTLKVPGLPRLTKVHLVEGLQANLVSISQLCDGENCFQFTQDKCVVKNNQNETILTGRRASNNCYMLDLGLPLATSAWISTTLKTPTA
ncbi:unnamed protein product [Rhodiola kirilowii]